MPRYSRQGYSLFRNLRVPATANLGIGPCQVPSPTVPMFFVFLVASPLLKFRSNNA